MHPWSIQWHAGHMAIWGIALILGVLVVLALIRRGGGPERRQESPEEILRRRYAAGEIDRETYERMLEDLRR